jgi:thiamine kinase-like enzyme
MLSLFNRANPFYAQTTEEKIDKTIFSFVDSETVATSLPLVNSSLRRAFAGTYADLRDKARERVLIYRKTLKPSSFFKNETADSFEYQRLSGGFTNCTFILRLQTQAAYISRIPGQGSELFIDRAAEFHNLKIAASLGLNPEVIYNDGRKGEQVTVYLEKPQPLTPDLLKSHPSFLVEIAGLFKKLHSSSQLFINDASIFTRNETLYALIRKSQLNLPAGYTAIRDFTEKMKRLFEGLKIKQVPCHNDPYYNNFLLSQGRIWLIDWEYAGNHDAIWDLAYFAKLAHLGEDQIHSLLTAYFETGDFKKKYPLEVSRFLAYQLVIDDFVFLWAYAQLANQNHSVDQQEFINWAEEALKSGLALLKSGSFNEAVAFLKEESSSLKPKLDY